ncbi:O-antigen ligase family protein [Blastococcus sp. SYSU DS0510]
MTSPATRGWPAARLLLTAMILAIALSPRIRVPGLVDRAVDLRLQDFLLVPVLIYLGARLPSLRRTWGPWPALFAFSATCLTAVHLFANPDMSALRAIGYLGRTLETFVLAAGIAGLYRLAGDGAWRTALRALHLAIAANVLWVTYQYVTGAQRTLIGSSVGDLVEAYGPKLVGEPSAFGTGFFFVLVTALGAAELLTKLTPRWVGGGLIAAGLLGAYLAQSRVSVIAGVLCAVAVLLFPDDRGRYRVIGGLTLVGAALIVVPRLPDAGRLSAAGVGNGIGVRTTPIWEPLYAIAVEHPLLGIGVGRLGTPAYPWTEAHNVALRAVLDYGIVIGALFLAIYVAIGWRAHRTAFAVDASPPAKLWGTLTLLLVGSALVAGTVQDTLIAVMSTHLVMLSAGLLGGERLGPLPDPPPRLTEVERRAKQALRYVRRPSAVTG